MNTKFIEIVDRIASGTLSFALSFIIVSMLLGTTASIVGYIAIIGLFAAEYWSYRFIQMDIVDSWNLLYLRNCLKEIGLFN